MLLLAAAPAQILSPSTGCTWRDPSSRRVYDLSSFAGREVSVAETLNGVDVQLFASICGNSQHKCKGASYPVVLLALGDCFSGGELTSQELTATKNGLSIAYSGGSECDALGGTASARAELECDPHEPEPFRVVSFTQFSMCAGSVTLRRLAALFFGDTQVRMHDAAAISAIAVGSAAVAVAVAAYRVFSLKALGKPALGTRAREFAVQISVVFFGLGLCILVELWMAA